MRGYLLIALTVSVVFGQVNSTAAGQDEGTISVLQIDEMEWKDYPGLPGVKFVVLAGNPSPPGQIGRASCRERV